MFGCLGVWVFGWLGGWVFWCLGESGVKGAAPTSAASSCE